jgi:hypothetical protein
VDALLRARRVLRTHARTLTLTKSHTHAQRSDLLLSLVHFQVLLGLIQLLLASYSPEWAAKKMEANALIADHAIFSQSVLTGIGFRV